MVRITTILISASILSCTSWFGGPRTGGIQEVSEAQRAAMAAVGAKVEATIVWSSSRFGNHDIFSMDADGGNLQRLSASEQVDWFPRFSPDGHTILFVRSKKGWVSEREANRTDEWDLFTMARDGSHVTKVAENASWGNWLDGGRIIFLRGGRIMVKTLASGTEEVFLHDEESEELKGLLLQQPQLSPDGNYLGLTLRGSRREIGVWDSREKVWNATGHGCQINWCPDGQSIYWVNPSGNGGSELLRMKVAGGRPAGKHQPFMDIPGRRSHEYFPQLSDDATWMVWAATQRGHDHDIADYEIYIWQVGAPLEEATRLTFHSGNDRWPDIHLR